MKKKGSIKEKIKKVNSVKVEADIKKMNDKDSRSTIIFVGISMMLGILVSDISIIVYDMVYSEIVKGLLIVSVISLIMYFILILLRKDSAKVFFTFGILNLNLTILSLYLRMANYLYFESSITKILIFIDFIIVEFLLFYKRIIIKNKDYINSIKNKTHDKYTQKDVLLALSIFNMVIVVSIILGIIPLKTFSGEPRLILSTIAYMELTPIAIVGCVTGMAKYLYRIK